MKTPNLCNPTGPPPFSNKFFYASLPLGNFFMSPPPFFLHPTRITPSAKREASHTFIDGVRWAVLHVPSVRGRQAPRFVLRYRRYLHTKLRWIRRGVGGHKKKMLRSEKGGA
jgi:hypothetical protein